MDNTCSNSFSFIPINTVPFAVSYTSVGLGTVLIGLIYFFNTIICFYWARLQYLNGVGDDSNPSSYIIFPVYIKILVLSAFADFGYGLVFLFSNANLNDSNYWSVTAILSAAVSFQALIVEGLAIFLMQHGCGTGALRRSAMLATAWAGITYAVFMVRYSRGPDIVGASVELAWTGALASLYLSLALLPSAVLHRREAAGQYGTYFGAYYFALFLTQLVYRNVSKDSVEATAADCGYVATFVLLFALGKPHFLYRALCGDARWWHGLGTRSNPASALDIGRGRARNLALASDHLESSGRVRVLNFAHFGMRWDRFLDAGSLYKVMLDRAILRRRYFICASVDSAFIFRLLAAHS